MGGAEPLGDLARAQGAGRKGEAERQEHTTRAQGAELWDGAEQLEDTARAQGAGRSGCTRAPGSPWRRCSNSECRRPWTPW